MNSLILGAAALVLSVGWLILLVASGFHGLVVAIGVLVVLSISGSTPAEESSWEYRSRRLPGSPLPR